MRAPVSWLREHADIPTGITPRVLADALVRVGLEVESVEVLGADLHGPLVVGRVLQVEVLTQFKKPIRWCHVEVGSEYGHPDTPGVRGIICGASNFSAEDLVVVALPGTVLPGGFAIASRSTYDHVSDGMICSERELALGDDHGGILVLPPGSGAPGDDAKPLLGIGDAVLDIAVTPDRGYCLSIRGIAREAAAALDVRFRDPGLVLADLPPAAGADPTESAIEGAASGCDLLVLRTVRHFDPTAPTPEWMRRRLAACGMRSISLAVDVTNYVMLELGQPLHAFDEQALRGTVVARRGRVGESLESLDHVVRTVHPEDVVIADDSGPISFAGTMGGLRTEIGTASADIVIEAAHFDAAAIARQSRRQKLPTEASRRFERGVDRELPAYASARAVQLLLAHGGGTYVGTTAVELPDEPTTIDLAVDLPGRIGGLAIDPGAVITRLRTVGCEVDHQPVAGTVTVRPPSWRPDLSDPHDLVEEVLRLDPRGYDAIPATIPKPPPGYGLSERQRLVRRTARAVAALGYVEVLSYPFVGNSDLDALGLGPGDARRRMLLLANPISEEQPGMRTTLLPGLLCAARHNVGRGRTDLALVETGSVTLLRVGQSEHGWDDPDRPAVDGSAVTGGATALLRSLDARLPDQPLHVAAVVSGAREPAGWWGPAHPAGWADAIQFARTIAAELRVEIDIRPVGVDTAAAPFHPGRCADVLVGELVVGRAGELHPRVVDSFGLPARAAAVELDLEPLLAGARPARHEQPLSTYPVAKVDIALVVPDSVPTSDVRRAVERGAGTLLEDVRLFDVYTGPQIPDGHRSLAFSLRLRAPDRTLADTDVTAAAAGAVLQAQALGAELRDL